MLPSQRNINIKESLNLQYSTSPQYSRDAEDPMLDVANVVTTKHQYPFVDLNPIWTFENT